MAEILALVGPLAGDVQRIRSQRGWQGELHRIGRRRIRQIPQPSAFLTQIQFGSHRVTHHPLAVGGPQGSHRCGQLGARMNLADQFLNHPLRGHVGTLAGVFEPNPPRLINQKFARPKPVLVSVGDRKVAVHHDRIRQPQPLDRLKDVLRIHRKPVLRRVNPDDHQIVGRISPLPLLQIRQRPQTIHATVLEEIQQDDFAPQGRPRQRRRVQPRQSPLQLRRRSKPPFAVAATAAPRHDAGQQHAVPDWKTAPHSCC